MLRLAPLLLLAPLAGCVSVSDANSDPRLGGNVELQYINDGRPPELPPPSTDTPDAPSLTGLSRDAWPGKDFIVPAREVEHQQTYLSHWANLTRSTAVQRGEYPTAQTADSSVTGGSQGVQRLEALLLPVQAAVDTALLIPRAMIWWPASPDRSPSLPAQRQPSEPQPPSPPPE